MSTPLEVEDAKVKADLQGIAKHVDAKLPFGWGFVLLAFPFSAGGQMNYVSNAQRADVVRAMYEFIEATKAGWAEDVPDDAAAEDEQLGRARQRVAELEGYIAQAVPLLREADERITGLEALIKLAADALSTHSSPGACDSLIAVLLEALPKK